MAKEHASLALSALHNALEEIFDLFSTGVFVVDKDRYVTDWSKIAEKITGYKKKEVLGRSCTDLLKVSSKSCNDLCHDDCPMLQVFKEGKSFCSRDNNLYYIHKKGMKRPIRISMIPIFDEEKKLIGGAEIIRDMTEEMNKQRELESIGRSEVKFHAIFEGATEGIVAVDLASKKFTFANQEMCRMTGYTVGELLTLDQYDIYPKERLIYILDQFEKQGRGTLTVAENIPILTKDEKIVYCDVSSPIMRLNGERYLVLFFRDISKRRAVEGAYHQSLQRLKEALVETVTAMSLTVEKRDPYTFSHQQRVAQLAGAIATELGLSSDAVDGVRLGALIHDIGKVYVPAEILNRPGALTDSEYDLVRTHPKVGFDIIKNINFPWPIDDMIQHHHERLDGSGYPDNLKGNAISIFCRILAVADIVEPMCSHRPYRSALGIDQALKAIKNGKDAEFDSDVVDACLVLFNKKHFEFEATSCAEC